MLKHIYTTLLLITIISAAAQPGALDVSFKPQIATTLEIRAIALQADGKILVGESITSDFFLDTSRITRLNFDGSLDTSFSNELNTYGVIRTIVPQADGKILVGGDFSRTSTDTVNSIFRLNTNGTLDTTFQTIAGFNNPVYTLTLQPDGKILAGGLFTNFNGTVCNRLARLNTDGSLDTSFHTQIGANGTVEEVLLQPDGKIIIGGDFTNYDGANSLRMARVKTNGYIDSSFVALPGASAVVFGMALQPDGKIIIGGNFNQYDFQPRPKFVRLNSNGGVDPSFAVNQGADSRVMAVEILNDGRVLLSGGFNTIRSLNIPRLALLASDCSPDTMFNDEGAGANEAVNCIKVQADGKIIIAGAFSSYNDVPLPRIARLYNCLTTQPGSISGDSIVNCPNTTLTYSIAPVQGADRYEWTLPLGWSGSSDSTSINVVSNGSPGTISVRAFSNACGYSYPQTKLVGNSTIPPPSICLVTVDTASTHNIVIWEKQFTNLIDSFCIYRETATNVYTKIASVPYDSLSEYHDYAANPNVTSYRYKLSTVDTCGVESELSLYHSTIHLQNLANGNFQWTFYQIEGQLNPILSFNFYRDANNNNNFFQIGNIPGTNSTYTDLTYNSFPDAKYVVDANWGISCTPSRAAINTTRSNIKKDKSLIFIGIDEAEFKDALLVYPNPASGLLNINTKGGQLASVALVNALGQTVWFEKESKSAFQISTQSLPKGVYAVIAETNKGKATTRVVLN